jgi:hypothetical protein
LLYKRAKTEQIITIKQQMRGSLFKFLSRYDEFGHHVNLNYVKGEEFKTWCGTTFSIIKLILLAWYFIHIGLSCITRRDPDIEYAVKYWDLEEEENHIKTEEYGFSVAY